MTIHESIEAFQSYLEGVRAHPDDEDLVAQLELARRELEIAWFRHKLEEL